MIPLSAKAQRDLYINLALSKRASQFPTSQWNPRNALNTNSAGNYDHGACMTAPPYKGRSWWKVYLDVIYNIKIVTILNRRDCCGKLMAIRIRRDCNGKLIPILNRRDSCG